jgi:hypothetical protein
MWLGPPHGGQSTHSAERAGRSILTDQQDLTAQRDALAALGVGPERTYVDHGLTGTNRDRPGLREALAACRTGDTLVVTKLDRLARSLPDARAILEDLTARQVKLSLGGAVHDPTDPVGRLLFNVLAMVAEFDADLIRLRTREGMRVAKAKCHLRASSPSSTPGRRPYSCRCTAPASTASASWATCSASDARLSIAPSSVTPSGSLRAGRELLPATREPHDEIPEADPSGARSESARSSRSLRGARAWSTVCNRHPQTSASESRLNAVRDLGAAGLDPYGFGQVVMTVDPSSQ